MEKKDQQAKLVVLVILDGWGVNQAYPGNAITQAKTPTFNMMVENYPAMTLRASGESVGLPWGEAGNSEVGHLNMGLGRIMYQDLPRINKEITDGSFYRNPVLRAAVDHVKKNHSKLHFMGVVSNGGVHASVDHLHALMKFAKKEAVEKVYVHAILDGRDTAYNSGLNFIKGVERSLKEFSIGHIATVAGRFYTMDRNNNWDRIEKAYIAMTEGVGEQAESASRAVSDSYKKKIYDEEFLPTIILENGQNTGKIEDNDAVVFYNYRPDRARQIAGAFVWENFDKFKRSHLIKNLFFATFTEYEKDLPVRVVFLPEESVNGLGECLSNSGLSQLRISETEKYAHVTYFFNGGREIKLPKEDHVLIPSPDVASYAEKPEMSSRELTDAIIKAIQNEQYDFILVNYPNADMVGHTGRMKETIIAVETLDACLARLLKHILDKDGVLMVTADHGNADVMFNMQTGQIDKEHSTNPVPLIVCGNDFQGKNFGWQDTMSGDLSLIQPQGVLADIAPTVLELFNIKKPQEMKGISLFDARYPIK